MWLIGGGIYAVSVFFALALCRVAGDEDGGTETGSCTTKPSATHVEYEQVVGLDGVRIDTAVDHDASNDLPQRDSRPRTASPRSTEHRKVPARR